MKLTIEKQDTTANRWTDWHILTVAEAGFSMLDIYGRHQHALDIEEIRQFADRVNALDQTVSLHPRAPISALPRRFFREQESDPDPSIMIDFDHRILEFIDANRSTIHARRILIDLHVSPANVPSHYVDATAMAVHLHGQDSIEEVVIFT
jgi:hypothetical protein